METTQESFKRLLEFGQEGEHEIAKWLMDRGVTVMPLYQFDPSHAPYLINRYKKTISPDLICFKDDAFMVEVKTKNQWVVYGDRVETGIDRNHYDHYKNVSQLTGKKVYVFFNHKTDDPCGFYYAELTQHTRFWDGKVKGKQVYSPMVFYNYNVLKKVNTETQNN